MTTGNGAPVGGCEPVFLPVLRFWSNYFARTADRMEAVLACRGGLGAEAAPPPPAAGDGTADAETAEAAPDTVSLLRNLQTGQEALLARLAAIEARLAALETGRKRKRRG